MPEGATLAELFPDPDETMYAQVNGELWPQSRWHDPLPAGTVNVMSVPHGDDALRVVAMVAVAVAAAVTGGIAAGAMGFTQGTVGYAVASGTVSSVIPVAGALTANMKALP
ncbi:hypothetical protein HML84_04840 [Alcanivorax sp. IO_7]|nr:hypothetical protein HML84_04840 [Alcanivorax sp. IO_7]